MDQPYKLTVDYRERAMPLETEHGHQVGALEVGDFRIDGPCGLAVLAERKSISDFAASIKDGRYREQKVRMLGAGARRVVYIVEGELDWGSQVHVGGLDAEALRTAVLKLGLVQGITVLRTADAGDTWRCVCGMLRRLNDQRMVLHEQPAASPAQQPYACSVRVRKSDNMSDPKQVAVLQLCVVPRVSPKIAALLLDAAQAGSMAAFCEYLKADAAVKTLGDLKVGCKRIGPALVQRIKAVICPGPH